MKLIFVYNADSGYFNKAADAMHKLVSPDTYSCNLCAVTYGLVGMKREWRRFIESLPVQVVFLHRDEHIRAGYRSELDLPAVLLESGSGAVTVLLDARAVNAVDSIDGLRRAVGRALETELDSYPS